MLKEFPQPRLVAESQQKARPGYTEIKADQYLDSKEVLSQKIKALADLIRKARHCVIYTGAGISVASGISDYATKASKSISGKKTQTINRLKLTPTYAHAVISAMEQKGYVKHWLQQNHDGLAQKAGFPQSKLNQIHGSWFDKKNTVVLMDDQLNTKNYEWLLSQTQKVDLCIAIGSSLSGMNADRLAQHASQTGNLCIINLQKTRLDSKSSLRIYGEVQSVMRMLRKQLQLKVKQVCLQQVNWKK